MFTTCKGLGISCTRSSEMFVVSNISCDWIVYHLNKKDNKIVHWTLFRHWRCCSYVNRSRPYIHKKYRRYWEIPSEEIDRKTKSWQRPWTNKEVYHDHESLKISKQIRLSEKLNMNKRVSSLALRSEKWCLMFAAAYSDVIYCALTHSSHLIINSCFTNRQISSLLMTHAQGLSSLI